MKFWPFAAMWTALAFGGVAPAFADDHPEIVVGYVMSATGVAASLGVHYRNAVELFPTEIDGTKVRYVVRDDGSDTTAAVNIVRLILEHEALRRDMAQQARSDALTGLLTRHAFIEEIERQIARLDRESEAGTLMFVDVDAFKAVNDRLGHATGDQVLVHVANMLRRLVRPFDVITRLGGDEFAVWLSGADHMTAAERADHLCKIAPGELQEMLPQPCPKLGLSVGIATRRSGSLETIEELLKRADMAMFEVKRSGRRHWRVSLLDGDS